LMANYRKTFSEKRRYIGITLSYNDNSMNSSSDRIQTYLSVPELAVLKNDLSDNLNKTLSWKSIYSNPLSETSTYSLGYSGSFTGLTMKNDYYYFDQGSNLFNEDLSKKSIYKNSNTKHTLSGNYDSSIWGFDYTLRLEYEQYYTNFEEDVSGNSFNKKYSYFLPGISIKKQIDIGQNIDLHFNRSFVYPLNKQINQHIDYSDTTNIVTGNPTLEPSYTNSIYLGYSYFAENILFTASGAYSKQENLIEKITIQNNMTSSITSYQNIAVFNRLTATISARTKIFNLIKIDPSINWSDNEYLGQNINSRSSSWSINLRTSTSFKNLRFQINFQYLSPQKSAQIKLAETYSADATVKMLLFDKQLSVSIKANDLFNTKNLNSRSYGNNFYSINGNRETTRIFSLNISYYFKVKSSEGYEENEDSKEYTDDF
ncbi:MAG: outer membrane beta-barrel family protein, partial [Melioribacteraceae bacterium]